MRRLLALASVLALTLALRPAAAAPITLAEPQLLPEISMVDMTGEPATLSEFRGKIVVLNLWATWCAPCREEMPALDRLQAEFAQQPVIVLALSVDRAGAERVNAFIDEVGARRLHVYRDPTAATIRTLRLPGLPATILVDKAGREAGRVLGIAEWDGPEAIAAVRQLLAEPSG